MAAIGEPRKIITIEPLEIPETVPEPKRETEPIKEPIPA